MSSVWKRFQRINKKATKFQFTASFHELSLHLTPKWQPHKLEVILQRRNRRVVTTVPEWEPGMKEPMQGSCVWMPPVNAVVTVTLFKDNHTHRYEDKDWTVVLEDISPTGKRRQVAIASLNMTQYAGVCHQTDLGLKLRPLSKKLVSSNLELTLSCIFLREGKATDEDMQSLASLMSMNAPNDIAPLDDLEEDECEDAANEELSSLTARISSLTCSLDYDPSSTKPEGEDDKQDSITEESITPIQQSPMLESVAEEFSEGDLKTPAAPGGDIGHMVSISALPTILTSTDSKRSSSPPVTGSPVEKQNGNSEKEKQPATFGEGAEKRTLQDRSALQPLNLPVSDVSSFTAATPGQDLISWCQEVVSGYRSIKITNMTTSWRNGMAFCAVIHSFRPDLIDFDSLSPQDIVGNCRTAFEAAEKMGIPRLIEPQAMLVQTVPDKLAVITYLHQLRAHFTGHELEVTQLGTRMTPVVHSSNSSSSSPGQDDSSTKSSPGNESTEVTYSNKIVPSPQVHTPATASGHVQTSTTPADTSSALKKRQQPLMTRQQLLDPFASDEEDDELQRQQNSNAASATANRGSGIGYQTPVQASDHLQQPRISETDVPGLLDLSPLSPTTSTTAVTSPHQPAQDSVTSVTSSASPSAIISTAFNTPPVTPATSCSPNHNTSFVATSPSASLAQATAASNAAKLSSSTARHEELKERARQLLEAARRDSSSSRSCSVANNNNVEASEQQQLDDDSERQAVLRQRARQLIAQAKQGALTPSNSFSNDDGSLQSPVDGGRERSKSPPSSSAPLTLISPTVLEVTPNKLQSFASLLDRISPDREKNPPTMKREGRSEYLQGQLAVLEEEQRHVDSQAAKLEKKLRKVMAAGNAPAEEERLMQKWFTLVNKKNALIRRQEQLSILEKESSLEQRFELLNRELRQIIAIDEVNKSEVQRKQEAQLLDELVQIVNMRNDLVTHLDSQEKMLDDDRRIAQAVSRASVRPVQDKCRLM